MFYKAVFRNSKIALLFAALTLFSAIRMVGSSEDGGVLVDAMDLARSVGARSANAGQFMPASPETAPAEPVFGEYAPQPEVTAEPMPEPKPEPTATVPREEFAGTDAAAAGGALAPVPSDPARGFDPAAIGPAPVQN